MFVIKIIFPVKKIYDFVEKIGKLPPLQETFLWIFIAISMLKKSIFVIF